MRLRSRIAAANVRLRQRWQRLPLVRQYALASLPVMALFTVAIGWWVTRAIESRVIENAGVNAALYVQSFVAPALEGLATRDEMTPDEMRAIEQLLRDTPLGKRILSFKVWKEGGKVVYYSRHRFIGHVFEPTENIRRAWRGEVRAEFEDLVDEEDTEEAKLGIPLLETYSPVRQRGSDRIVAVAEFYQDARELEAQLGRTRLATWLVVALGAVATYGVLFLIVRAGGQTIRRQRELLRRRVDELSALLAENEELGRRVRRATRRATELNERFLRRVSAELHDGPAQAIGLALLRLDALEAEVRAAARAPSPAGDGVGGEGVEGEGGDEAALEPLREMRDTLADALAEVRQISRGLALPELSDLDLRGTIETAAIRHGRRTGTDVAIEVDTLDESISAGLPLHLTAYRFVQEGLMNAFRHAGARGQRVRAWAETGCVVVQVSDDGPGFEPAAAGGHPDRLGLRGLRERVESLGGGFELDSAPDRGTTLTARLPLEKAA